MSWLRRLFVRDERTHWIAPRSGGYTVQVIETAGVSAGFKAPSMSLDPPKPPPGSGGHGK